MDALLKRLAAASMHVGAGEEALAEGAHGAAREELDAAADVLAALRAEWPRLDARERTLVGRTAAPLRARLDAAVGRLPRASALSTGLAEADPEQELEPEG